ncbi:MAG: signal peptidase [Chloroflexota bacterium]|nr:signal peptidase [Chloroflexota bacterium]MEA2606591.1 signal peptidase [Chloroflexota bacterium]
MTRTPAIGCLLEIAETLILTLIIFWVIQSFVAQPFKVQQMSMERTLEPDQYVLVDKLTPHFSTYKVGDIVVFTPPKSWVAPGGEPYIKRIIGVGGETVHIQDGAVFVDGTKLVEPYVFKDADGQAQPTEPLTEADTWVIPDGQLMLMGDHRAASADSREFGPVDVSAVIGRAWLRYWPLDTFEIIPTPAHPELATAAP